jgi:hypothetical protein
MNPIAKLFNKTPSASEIREHMKQLELDQKKRRRDLAMLEQKKQEKVNRAVEARKANRQALLQDLFRETSQIEIEIGYANNDLRSLSLSKTALTSFLRKLELLEQKKDRKGLQKLFARFKDSSIQRTIDQASVDDDTFKDMLTDILEEEEDAVPQSKEIDDRGFTEFDRTVGSMAKSGEEEEDGPEPLPAMQPLAAGPEPLPLPADKPKTIKRGDLELDIYMDNHQIGDIVKYIVTQEQMQLQLEDKIAQWHVESRKALADPERMAESKKYEGWASEAKILLEEGKNSLMAHVDMLKSHQKTLLRNILQLVKPQEKQPGGEVESVTPLATGPDPLPRSPARVGYDANLEWALVRDTRDIQSDAEEILGSWRSRLTYAETAARDRREAQSALEANPEDVAWSKHLEDRAKSYEELVESAQSLIDSKIERFITLQERQLSIALRFVLPEETGGLRTQDYGLEGQIADVEQRIRQCQSEIQQWARAAQQDRQNTTRCEMLAKTFGAQAMQAKAQAASVEAQSKTMHANAAELMSNPYTAAAGAAMESQATAMDAEVAAFQRQAQDFESRENEHSAQAYEWRGKESQDQASLQQAQAQLQQLQQELQQLQYQQQHQAEIG